MTDTPPLKAYEVTVLVTEDTGLLEVSTELLGQKLVFNEGSTRVEIRLPTEGSNALKQSFVVGTERYFHVESVALAVFVDHNVELPDSVPDLTGYYNQNKPAFDHVYNVAKAGADIARPAFDRWSRMLRFKSMNPWILRNEPEPRTKWNGRVVFRDSEQNIQGTGSTELKVLHAVLKAEHWRSTEAALQAGESSPVYVDLLLDSERHRTYGDLNRCLIDAASACEIYMRTKVVERLPAELNPELVQHIEGMSGNSFYERFFPAILTDGKSNPTWKSIKDEIRDLFRARNRVLHRGEQGHVTSEQAYEFGQAARVLITLS